MGAESKLGKPMRLRFGDRVGLVNTVGDISPKYAGQTLSNAFRYLESKGYKIVEQPTDKTKLLDGVQNPEILADYYDPYITDESSVRFNPYNATRRSFLTSDGSSVEERARLFNEAVEKCRILFPMVGNKFGLDVVDLIDYSRFARNKPIFTTFSAASAFLLKLHFQTNTVVFYGPHIHFLASTENKFTESSFWNFINQVSNWDRMQNNYSPFFGYETEQSGVSVVGKLMPMFLFSLEEIVKRGRLDIDPKNKILILEADERSYDECLEALKVIHSGVDLTKLSALVLASFATFKPDSEELGGELSKQDNIIEFVAKTRKLLKGNTPVIYGFPMGHSKDKLTIPMGITAELDLHSGDVILKENPFSDTR